MGTVYVHLPPIPRRKPTPEQRAETAAMFAELLAHRERNAAKWAQRKARITPAQRARRAAQDDVRTLRRLLQETADANRWARITAALDDFGAEAYHAKVDADKVRARVMQRTRRVYQRAADGCEVSAAFLADDAADALYAAAFNDPAGSLQQ